MAKTVAGPVVLVRHAGGGGTTFARRLLVGEKTPWNRVRLVLRVHAPVFGDVEGDGVPERDEYVTSGNCQ